MCLAIATLRVRISQKSLLYFNTSGSFAQLVTTKANSYDDLFVQKYIYMLLSRCGQGLYDLYFSNQIQSFLNCVSAQEANKHKLIYQPGCLRKVQAHTSHIQVTIQVIPVAQP